MKIALAAAAALLAVAATPVFSARFQMVSILDGDRPALEAGNLVSERRASLAPGARLLQADGRA